MAICRQCGHQFHHFPGWTGMDEDAAVLGVAVYEMNIPVDLCETCLLLHVAVEQEKAYRALRPVSRDDSSFRTRRAKFAYI